MRWFNLPLISKRARVWQERECQETVTVLRFLDQLEGAFCQHELQALLSLLLHWITISPVSLPWLSALGVVKECTGFIAQRAEGNFQSR